MGEALLGVEVVVAVVLQKVAVVVYRGTLGATGILEHLLAFAKELMFLEPVQKKVVLWWPHVRQRHMFLVQAELLRADHRPIPHRHHYPILEANDHQLSNRRYHSAVAE